MELFVGGAADVVDPFDVEVFVVDKVDNDSKGPVVVKLPSVDRFDTNVVGMVNVAAPLVKIKGDDVGSNVVEVSVVKEVAVVVETVVADDVGPAGAEIVVLGTVVDTVDDDVVW